MNQGILNEKEEIVLATNTLKVVFGFVFLLGSESDESINSSNNFPSPIMHHTHKAAEE